MSNVFNSSDDINQLRECKNYLLIFFDDCIFQTQHIIKNYFATGGYKNIVCVLLSQCYIEVEI